MGMISKERCLLWALCCIMAHISSAQSISVGTPIVEDYLRRQQMLGLYDSSATFGQRPFFFDPDDSLQSVVGVAMEVYRNDPWKLNVSVLAPHTHIEYHSHHPQYSNNGPITPAKGWQSLTSLGGVHVRWLALSLQIKPEILLSQNRMYDGFPDTLSDRQWDKRFVMWNQADLPEHHGLAPKNEVLLGQSHAMLTHWNIGLGVSTENLWWGPGRRNSLTMSNNARGFAHLTLKTMKPIWTPIGYFEGQLLGGRLEDSGYAPTEKPFRNGLRRFAGRNPDDRYLSGLHLSYSPKWIPGLTLGTSRAVQQYMERAKEKNDYFPVFINLFRQNDGNRDEGQIDQVLSVYARWVSKKTNAEMYFEFGRNDASLNLRDFLLGPNHSRAYIFGFSKLFKLGSSGRFLEFSYEHTEMAQNVSYIIRDAFSWYMHSWVRQGYTNRGEVLGAAIGPGSNLDYFGLAYVNGLNRYGLRIERLANDNDFFYLAYEDQRDFRRFWVDYSFGVEAVQKLPWVPLVVEGSFLFTRSLNYQWELFNNPNNQPYFVSGNDVSNVQLIFKALYLF